MKAFKEYSQEIDEASVFSYPILNSVTGKAQAAKERAEFKRGVSRLVSKAKYNAKKKAAKSVKEESELDEGMYLVGTYSNPKKEHIRVWQHSPAGYHYSIENTKNKKILTHHGSLDAAVKKHSLVLNKEEYEPAPNVPRHIRAHANRSGGTHYNILGKLQKKQFTKDKQDHDDEGAIERAAARRKGLDW
jgi:hypothetical protein